MTLRRGFVVVAVLAGCSANVPEVDRYDPVVDDAMKESLRAQVIEIRDREGWVDYQAAIVAIQGRELELRDGEPLQQRCSFARVAADALQQVALYALTQGETDPQNDTFVAAAAIGMASTYQKRIQDLKCAVPPPEPGTQA